MEITVKCRGQGRAELVKACAGFIAKELKISNSTWKLQIQLKRFPKEEGIRGSVIDAGPKQLVMFLESSMEFERFTEVLSHEMVHVKQFVRGQYKQEIKRGLPVHYWMGKQVKAKYYDQPWEQDAWSRERILSNKLFAVINQE